MPTLTDYERALEQKQANDRQSQLLSMKKFGAEQAIYNKDTVLYNSMFPAKADYSLTDFKSDDFGSSRFDERAYSLSDYVDPTDLRAREQSGIGQFANALVKTAVTTATTAANMINAATFAPLYGTFGGSFIDNPVSRMLVGIEKEMEEMFPNYRSNLDNELPWYRKMDTINFWADDIMKNIGFSMGSVLAAKGATKLLMTGVRELTKKSYASGFRALGKSFNSKLYGSEIRKVLSQEAKTLGDNVSKRQILDKLGRISKAEDIVASVTGSILGALGESQYEALNAVIDFTEKNKGKLDRWFASNDGYIRMMYDAAGGLDEDGNPISYEDFKQTKYDEAVNEIDVQAHKVGNSVFGYEFALLSATNFSTFRRFFSGGFKNYNPLTYNVSLGATARNEISSKIGKRILDDGTKEAFNKYTKLKKTLELLSPMIVEGPVEEMGQNFINKASEYNYGSYLNEHIGFLLNSEYNHQAVDPINAISVGAARSYGDASQWLDGFAGAIFGLAGVPGIKRNESYKAKPEEGPDNRSKGEKNKYSLNAIPFFTSEGSIRQKFKEIQDRDKLINETVAAVNDFIKSPEQQNKFRTAVLNIAYADKMKKSLEAKDIVEYKDAEQQELMNIVAAFSNAGMNDVLDEYIDSIGNNLSDEKIAEIKDMLSEEEKDKPLPEIRKRIQKEVSDVKKLINDYRDVHDQVNLVYGSTFTPRETDVLASMLALADYKNNRATEILDNYDELFAGGLKGKTMAEKTETVVSLLGLDDKAWDNNEKLPEEARKKLAEDTYAGFMKKLPNEWNVVKKHMAFQDIFDAYRNILGARIFNNEFAAMVSNPQLMNRMFKKMFNDHLGEEEQKAVENILKKLTEAKTSKEVENIYNSLGDDNIGNTVKSRMDLIENESVKSFIQTKKLKDLHDNVVSSLKSGAEPLASYFGISVSDVDDIADKLGRANAEDAVETLNNLYQNETNEGKKKLISHALSLYNMQRAVSETKTEANTEVTEDDLKKEDELNTRKKEIDAFLNEDAFKNVVNTFWRNENEKSCFVAKGKFTNVMTFALNDDMKLTAGLVNDLYYNRIYFSFVLESNGATKRAVVTIDDKTAYNKERHFNPVSVRNDITEAIMQLTGSENTAELNKLSNTITNRLWYNPFNENTVEYLKKNSFDGFLGLFDITENKAEEQPQKTEEEKQAERKKLGDSLAKTIRDEANRKYHAQQDVIDEIDNIPLSEYEKYGDLETLRKTAVKTRDDIELLRKLPLLKRQDNTEDMYTEENIDELYRLLNNINSVKLIAIPEKKDILQQSPKSENNKSGGDLFSEKPYTKYDHQWQNLAPVTEYDLPDNDVLDPFGEELSTERTEKSAKARKIDGYNIDSYIRQDLKDANAYENMFYLQEGDVIHFVPVQESSSKETIDMLSRWYGDELPYHAVDSKGRIVGMIVPDYHGSLYDKIKRNKKATVKIKAKFASKSTFKPRGNSPATPSADKHIMFFVTMKGVVVLSEGDVDNYRRQYGFTDKEYADVVNEIKKLYEAGRLEYGSAYRILDRGDHFRKGPGNTLHYYWDKLSLIQTSSLPEGMTQAIADRAAQLLGDAPTAQTVASVNSFLRMVLATGYNVYSEIKLQKNIEGNYRLVAEINTPDGRGGVNTETIDLIEVGQNFRNDFKNLLDDNNLQANVPGGIVISFNANTLDSTDHTGIGINNVSLRNTMRTYMTTDIPVNINAEMDTSSVNEGSNEETHVPDEVVDEIETKTVTFDGESEDEVAKRTESLRAVRQQFEETIPDYGSKIAQLGLNTSDMQEFVSNFISNKENGLATVQEAFLKELGIVDSSNMDMRIFFATIGADFDNKQQMEELLGC